jgi:competence ComEA-like helix-hairpin-helix protein
MSLMKRLVFLPLLLAGVFGVGGLYAQDLPEGLGKDTVETTCTACHDLSPVMSMSGTADIWQSVVDDMKSRGADASESDFRAIVQYLSKYYGPPVHINTDAAKDIQTNLGLTADEAAAIVKYRTDKGNFKEWGDLAKVPGLDMSKLAGLQQRVKY